MVVIMIRRVRPLSKTPFEAGGKSAFLTRIVGLSAQIFENLVGREVEVMLLRSVAARKGGGRA